VSSRFDYGADANNVGKFCFFPIKVEANKRRRLSKVSDIKINAFGPDFDNLFRDVKAAISKVDERPESDSRKKHPSPGIHIIG
jgi:hypothetical protein